VTEVGHFNDPTGDSLAAFSEELPASETKAHTKLRTHSIQKGLSKYDGVSKSFRTGCLERELQMMHLSATRCSCIAMSQSSEFCRHNPLCCYSASVYCYKRIFRYDSVRKLLDTPSYIVCAVARDL
jgi:hypothetical protein